MSKSQRPKRGQDDQHWDGGYRDVEKELMGGYSEETLPEEVLNKMGAGASLVPKYPVITTEAFAEADGIIIGAPTR